MEYSQNVRNAARRHFRSAQILYDHPGTGDQPGCTAVAGYLFGIAGELAVKEIMRNSGITPLPEADRRDDPFYAHFPLLKTLLRTKLATVAGRRSGELRQFSEDPRLFQNWDVKMRYAPTTDVNRTWVEAWKVSAEKLIARMEIS